MTDPFEDPTPHSSAFASADSFRNRLIFVQPTKIEHDVPKSSANPTGPRGDRITATVTVVDGAGPVHVYSQRVRTDKVLDGPTHRGVWFNQDQIVEGLLRPDGVTLRKGVLMRIDTLKPGTMAGQGNPWVVTTATDAEKDTARQFLAAQMVNGSAPTTPAQQAAPAAGANPFAAPGGSAAPAPGSAPF
jgi:hypothetical protein